MDKRAWVRENNDVIVGWLFIHLETKMCRGRADHEIISPGRRSHQCKLPFLHYKPRYDKVVYNILLKLSCCIGVVPAPDFIILSAWSVFQAEVQSVYADGALLLHTRSLKYGKVSSA